MGLVDDKSPLQPPLKQREEARLRHQHRVTQSPLQAVKLVPADIMSPTDRKFHKSRPLDGTVTRSGMLTRSARALCSSCAKKSRAVDTFRAATSLVWRAG